MHSIDEYFRSQQVPLQWSPVLRALAEELCGHAGVDPQAVHQLFKNIGARFAHGVHSHFEGISTLPQLIEAINDFWSLTHWGWVEISEAKGCLEIEHRYAPLAEAFGVELIPSTVGILEGFYEAVFHSFGASEKLKARFMEQQNDGFLIHIRLSGSKP